MGKATTYVSIEVAAQLVARHEQTIRNWARDGKLRWREMEGRHEYHEGDLLEMVGRLPTDDRRDQEIIALRRDLAQTQRDLDAARSELRDRKKQLDSFQKSAKDRYRAKNAVIDKMTALGFEHVNVWQVDQAILGSVLEAAFAAQEERFNPHRPQLNGLGFALARWYYTNGDESSANKVFARLLAMVSQLRDGAPIATRLQKLSFTTVLDLLALDERTEQASPITERHHNLGDLRTATDLARLLNMNSSWAAAMCNAGRELHRQNELDAAGEVFAQSLARARKLIADGEKRSCVVIEKEGRLVEHWEIHHELNELLFHVLCAYARFELMRNNPEKAGQLAHEALCLADDVSHNQVEAALEVMRIACERLGSPWLAKQWREYVAHGLAQRYSDEGSA